MADEEDRLPRVLLDTRKMFLIDQTELARNLQQYQLYPRLYRRICLRARQFGLDGSEVSSNEWSRVRGVRHSSRIAGPGQQPAAVLGTWTYFDS